MAGRFTAANLGSFLRPAYLLDARAKSLPEPELRKIEDRELIVRTAEKVWGSA